MPKYMRHKRYHAHHHKRRHHRRFNPEKPLSTEIQEYYKCEVKLNFRVTNLAPDPDSPFTFTDIVHNWQQPSPSPELQNIIIGFDSADSIGAGEQQKSNRFFQLRNRFQQYAITGMRL